MHPDGPGKKKTRRRDEFVQAWTECLWNRFVNVLTDSKGPSAFPNLISLPAVYTRMELQCNFFFFFFHYHLGHKESLVPELPVISSVLDTVLDLVSRDVGLNLASAPRVNLDDSLHLYKFLHCISNHSWVLARFQMFVCQRKIEILSLLGVYFIKQISRKVS